MIPGQNLLNMALTLIAKQVVIYYQFLSRSPNSVGQDVTNYAEPFEIVGSFQAIPRKEYYLYGLNLQKNYSTFYSSNNVLDIERDVSGDQLIYAGKRYQVESNNNWYAQDGWKGILVVEIGEENA